MELELTDKEFELLNLYLTDYVELMSDPFGVGNDTSKRELNQIKSIARKVKNAYIR